jgi:hypothetical protein
MSRDDFCPATCLRTAEIMNYFRASTCHQLLIATLSPSPGPQAERTVEPAIPEWLMQAYIRILHLHPANTTV